MLIDTEYRGKKQESNGKCRLEIMRTKALSTLLLSKDTSLLPEVDLPISLKSVTGKSTLRRSMP